MMDFDFFNDLKDYIGNVEISDSDQSNAFVLADVIADDAGEPINDVMARGIYDLIIKHQFHQKSSKQNKKTVIKMDAGGIPLNELDTKNEEITYAAMYCLTLDPFVFPENWPKKYKNKILEKSVCERYSIASDLIMSEIARLNIITCKS